jgi:hypothetical protein
MEPGHEEEAMSVTAEITVRELTLENRAATRVFEKLGIDYCCGGTKKRAGRLISRWMMCWIRSN